MRLCETVRVSSELSDQSKGWELYEIECQEYGTYLRKMCFENLKYWGLCIKGECQRIISKVKRSKIKIYVIKG